MRFEIIAKSNLSYIKGDMDLVIPLDIKSDHVPLIYVIYGLFCVDSDVASEYFLGIDVTSNSLQVDHIHKDDIKIVLEQFKAAVDNFQNYVYFDGVNIITKNYKRPNLYESFPEKLEKEKEIKETAKEKLLEHIRVEQQLNMELI